MHDRHDFTENFDFRSVADPLHSSRCAAIMKSTKLSKPVTEVLTYCIIKKIKPSIIRDNFVLIATDGEVFAPLDINTINRVEVKRIRDSLDSHRRNPLGKSKFTALKHGWKFEDILRPKTHSTVALPPFTEQDYQSQFLTSNTATTPASSATSSSSSAKMRVDTDALSGFPEVLHMNRLIDDIYVSYYLGIRLDEHGRGIVSNPWSFVFYLMNRGFKKDGKLTDGLVIFFQASNKVELTFNAVEVPTIAKSKKAVIIREADRFDTEFFDEMHDDLMNDHESFGTSTQAADLCKAMEQQVKEFNKKKQVVSYGIEFLDFPYTLTPGTYQWKHTSEIDEDGLTARLLQTTNGEAAYFVVVDFEENDGGDDLEDIEEEDVKAKAKKKAEERMNNRRRKSTAAAAGRSSASVDDIVDDLSSLKIDEDEVGSQARSRRSIASSPTQLRRKRFYKLLHDKFKDIIEGGSGRLGCMSAISTSLLFGANEEDVTADALYAESLSELYESSDYYSQLFDVEVADLAGTLLAQLQGLANRRGLYFELYDFDDYRGGRNIPKAEVIEPDEIGPVAVVCILKDGEDYFALDPIPADDPEDSPTSSTSSENSPPPLTTDKDEKKQPGSLEKAKNWLFGSKKTHSPAVEEETPLPSVSTPRADRTPARKDWSKKSSTKKNRADNDDTSTHTVQTGSARARKKLDFQNSTSKSAAARKTSAAKENKKTLRRSKRQEILKNAKAP
eukprot:scaffold4173_cov88-Skeletonema_menzelii.AAC.2